MELEKATKGTADMADSLREVSLRGDAVILALHARYPDTGVVLTTDATRLELAQAESDSISAVQAAHFAGSELHIGSGWLMRAITGILTGIFLKPLVMSN